MNFECAIIGGGPAGLSAALVLGRARRTVALLDNGQPRNRVTRASHGFLTRDGIPPSEFRRIAYEEVLNYPSVKIWQSEVAEIRRMNLVFTLRTSSGEFIQARKLIVAAGLREVFPEIKGLRDFYGKSVFECPFCDGWELRDQPLVVVSDHPGVFQKVKLLLNWSRDLVVCTNGRDILTSDQRQQLAARGIPVVDTPVAAFVGRSGMLESVHFTDGTYVERRGGFVSPAHLPIARSTAAGVYAAGDSAYVAPSQLIYAAASGSKAAMAVVADLAEENWSR
jgi:thioredoxin reductase